MKPEAAIVNVYSPGDTLSLHRDVSEESDNGLVSISIGCDGIFIAGLEGEDDENTTTLIVRLRSGDAVYMSGRSRYAWHGVPQIISDTCPSWLRAWPAELNLSEDTISMEADERANFSKWKGWMGTKRINLNIRQMNPS